MVKRTASGEMVPLEQFVRVEELSSPPQLYHYNRYQSATVSAALAPGRTIGEGIAVMRAAAAKVLDESFSTSLTGASRDFAESSSNILFAFLLALLLIYLVLAAQFESFRDPLVGLVTKNGILIVEFANQLQEKGLAKMEAAKEAAVARLRPILMTSLATALGAVPIALALGAGAKSRMGMGIVIIGGLMFSLILTLFVIPAIYTYLSSTKNKVQS